MGDVALVRGWWHVTCNSPTAATTDTAVLCAANSAWPHAPRSKEMFETEQEGE